MIFIYTCKARLNAALQVYDMLWNVEEKKYIVYGDSIEEEYRLTDTCLVLNVGDYYEHLSEKTKKMFQVAEKLFPGEFILKMDDDILPNSAMIQEHLDQLKEIQYAVIPEVLCFRRVHDMNMTKNIDKSKYLEVLKMHLHARANQK